jgi:hypothetical protein
LIDELLGLGILTKFDLKNKYERWKTNSLENK